MKSVLIACLIPLLPGGVLAGDPLPSTANELQKGREELNDLLTRYTERHPLVMARRQEIVALEKRAALQQPQQAKPTYSPQLLESLRKAREELNDLLTRYTERHPLAVARRAEIVALE